MSSLQTFLEKGFFPRELPPPFNTDAYAAYALAYGTTWNKTKWTGCVSHNLARPGGLRRPLRIPHPIGFYGIAELLSNEWASIKQHTWKQRLSASRPHVMKNSSRAVVPRYRFGELPRMRALRRRGTRYLLKTDINLFYPTLYTHTIPWALHTKAVCKAALSQPGKGANLLGNKLDKLLQCLNDGQTHGIPIGPDTSLIAAEILLAAADAELLQRCPGIIRGFRYVDDYELSFSNLRDGEAVLAELQNVLSAYELSLNPRKTTLEEMPKALEETWGSELGRFQIREANHPVGQRNDIVSFFSRAFEIAHTTRQDPVLRYAIARLQSINVASCGWRAFHNCLLGAANADASAIPVALGTLFQAALAGGHPIAKAPLAELFESIVEHHARRGEGSEVAWALWGALAWSVPLSQGAAKAVSGMEDDIVALLALDVESRGLFPPGALNKQEWDAIVNQPDALHGQHWLLTYEAVSRNWLASSSVGAHNVLGPMSGAGVRFYDPARNVPQFPPGARGNPGGALTNYYA